MTGETRQKNEKLLRNNLNEYLCRKQLGRVKISNIKKQKETLLEYWEKLEGCEESIKDIIYADIEKSVNKFYDENPEEMI